MKRKGMYIRTIIGTIITILVFVGLHMYNHMTIQAMKYTDEWGRSIKVGSAYINQKPLMGAFDEKLLAITFNKEGQINYYLTAKNGEVLDTGMGNIEDFNRNHVEDIAIIRDSLFFLKDQVLYKTSYVEGNGFTDPEILASGINGFNVSVVDKNSFIQTFNDKKINIYLAEENGIKLESSYDNLWNVQDMFLSKANNESYVILVRRADDIVNQVLAGTLKDIETNNLKVVDEFSNLPGTYIGDINLETNEDNFYIIYPVTKMQPGGARSEFVDIRVIDSDGMGMLGRNRITTNDIDGAGELDKGISTYVKGGKVKIVASGINRQNKYASYNDIFTVDVDSKGNISKATFVATTQSHSKTPHLIDTGFGQYLAWYDLESKEYDLMLNSTNQSFKAANMKFTKEDYKDAFFKAMSSPFYALAFTFIKGTMILLYLSVIFLPAAYLIRKFRVQNERLRLWIFIGLYILVNVISFKGTYYSGTGSGYMPDILRAGIAPYIVPLLINLVSGTLLYAFYKDKKHAHYVAYITFFIIIDIYLANFLYVPFTMIKSLLV